MKLGDRHIIDGKEYVGVYEGSYNCKRCEMYPEGMSCEKMTICEVSQNGREQQIVWIEVKK